MRYFWLCVVLVLVIGPRLSFGELPNQTGYNRREAHLAKELEQTRPRFQQKSKTTTKRQEARGESGRAQIAGEGSQTRHPPSRLGVLKLLISRWDDPEKEAVVSSPRNTRESPSRSVRAKRRSQDLRQQQSNYAGYYPAYYPEYPANEYPDEAELDGNANVAEVSKDDGGGDAGHEWGDCDVPCGIGYQRRPKVCYDQPDAACSGEEGTEVRRCLGIDCADARALEEELACGGASFLIIGIVVGMVIVVVLIGAGCGFTKFILPKIRESKKASSSVSKRKGSKRAPAPPPRTEKTTRKGGHTSDEPLYEEIDGLQDKRAKANTYVTMTSKKKESQKKKRIFGSKKKQKVVEMSESEEDSDGYVDPDEINQPGSEELDIERLREPPPPPGSDDEKKSKVQKSKSPDYEVPRENDYMELDE